MGMGPNRRHVSNSWAPRPDVYALSVIYAVPFGRILSSAVATWV
jgi:hypothetical protein